MWPVSRKEKNKSQMENSLYKHLCYKSNEKTELSSLPGNSEQRVHEGINF